MAKAVAKKAPPKAVVVPKLVTIAPVVKVTSEVTTVRVSSQEIEESLEVENGKFVGGYLNVGNMEICSDGLNDLMDLSENEFSHLVSAITLLRAKTTELKK